MTLSKDSAGRVRALIYPILFEVNPRDGIVRVIDRVVAARCLDSSPQEYLSAIREALSQDDLAPLVPRGHTEASIREFLTDVAVRIEERWGPKESRRR